LLYSNHSWQAMVATAVTSHSFQKNFLCISILFFVDKLHELAQSLHDFVIICHGPPTHTFVVD
jgi:hypothetical protein